MRDQNPNPGHSDQHGGPKQSPGMRLVRVIVVETIVVALIGFFVWGFAWELTYPRVGLVLAIVIWLTVSPVIEIAAVANYRRESGKP